VESSRLDMSSLPFFKTYCRSTADTSAAGNRRQNVEGRSRSENGIQSAEIPDVLAVDENVHERTQISRLQTQIEAESRKRLVERRDDVTHRLTMRGHSETVTYSFGQHGRQ